MKNNSKFNGGFIVPLIVGIVAVLILGGVYLAWKNNQASNTVSSSTDISASNNLNSNQSVNEVSNVNAVSDSSSSPSNSGNWETYAGANFSVQYPQGWTVTNSQVSSGSYVTFKSPTSTTSDSDQFGISVSPISTANNANTLFNKLSKLLSNTSQSSSIVIDGVSASRIDYADSSAPSYGDRIFFDKGTNTYQITEQGQLHYNSVLFNEFANSFKFTN